MTSSDLKTSTTAAEGRSARGRGECFAAAASVGSPYESPDACLPEVVPNSPSTKPAPTKAKPKAAPSNMEPTSNRMIELAFTASLPFAYPDHRMNPAGYASVGKQIQPLA